MTLVQTLHQEVDFGTGQLRRGALSLTWTLLHQEARHGRLVPSEAGCDDPRRDALLLVPLPREADLVVRQIVPICGRRDATRH